MLTHKPRADGHQHSQEWHWGAAKKRNQNAFSTTDSGSEALGLLSVFGRRIPWDWKWRFQMSLWTVCVQCSSTTWLLLFFCHRHRPPPPATSLQQPSILLYEAVRMVWRQSLSVVTFLLKFLWIDSRSGSNTDPDVKKKMSEADLLSLNNHDCIAVFDRQRCRCVSQGWLLYGARWALLLINKLKSPSSIPDELIRGLICSLACGRCTWFN